MIYTLSFKKRSVFIRFGVTFNHKFQIQSSPENIMFFQQKVCTVFVLQIASLGEVHFFVLASNLSLKLHLFNTNHEASIFKKLAKSLRDIN